MQEAVLTASNLQKRFGHMYAVNGVSLRVKKGNVYGILGPNGSGKSTTLGMILGVLKPTAGSYSWFGTATVSPPRGAVGTLLEQPNFYNNLSAVQNLQICANIKGVPYSDIDRVLQATKLADRSNTRFRNCSTGMKQRLAIANAMLGQPELLILDEPTNGLDPQGIAEVRELIVQLKEEGHTIILASHLLDEVEKVCTHMLVLQKGKVKYEGEVKAFVNRSGGSHRATVRAADLPALQELMKKYEGINRVESMTDRLLLHLKENISAEDINRFAFQHGITLSHLSIDGPTLEQQFLELTGKA